MNQELYVRKLSRSKRKIVPALFTERQFEVLLKRLREETLTQTERNYLSNAIKRKIEAIAALRGLALEPLTARPRFGEVRRRILASYGKAGITFQGVAAEATPFSSTETVKQVLSHYERLEARIVAALPTFIAKELRNLDLLDIYAFSREQGVINFTGYIFTIVAYFADAHALPGRRRIAAFLTKWAETKDAQAVAKNPDLLKASITPEAFAKSWNVVTLNSIETYKRYFDLYGAT